MSILGTGASARVIGTMEIVFKNPQELPVSSGFCSDVDFYAGDMKKTDCHEHAPVEILVDDANKDRSVLAAEKVALAAWRALGCCDLGRVDVRYEEEVDVGNGVEVAYPVPYVLEVTNGTATNFTC